MKRRHSFLAGIAFGAALTAGLVVLVAASSTEKISSVDARPREVYSPNSESLASDEMRVIACGTGMPTTRAAQAAACFLVELGNGDKFLFDIGSGSAERISSPLGNSRSGPNSTWTSWTDIRRT
jgi:ribonuclease Z